jgi:uncharacterized membrane protein YuzA (DUF378 family)
MLRLLYRLTVALVLIGAINWGLVGVFRFNLVKRLLGTWEWAERLVYATVGIAGTAIALTLTVPRLLLSLEERGTGEVTAEERRSIVGQQMPTVSGRTLTGKEVTLPRDARGKFTFLLLAFSYEARFDVEDWEHAFRDRFGENPNVDFFLLPVISPAYRLFAPMIDAGMRRGTPSAMHDHVVTLYTSPRSVREAFGAARPSNVWVYLVDRDGKVLFQYGGPFDRQKFQELASTLEAALARAGVGG